MGMAFPLGLKVASVHAASRHAEGRSELVTPWLWGINGAMGVFASVAAIVIALLAGISTAYWIGVAAYFVGAVALLLANKQA